MKRLFFPAFLLVFGQLHGQVARQVTLREALDLAAANSVALKKSALDRQSLESRIREERSAGLPQVSAGLDFDTYPLLPTQVLPGDYLNRPGEYVPVRIGQPWQLTGSISVEQMLFSESGRRAKPAADASRALLDLLTEKTADEVAFQTASVFYQTLQTRELLRTLDANLEKLSALQRMAQLQFTNGYATSTDVKRIRVAKTNLETQRTNLLAAVEALENTLKFLCGQPFEQPFVPTENLNAPAADSSKWQSLAFDPANLTETRLLQKNMELNRTRYHALAGEKYPTVSAYATGLYQSQRADPNFFSGKTYWFGTAVIGVRARVKLFDGFRRKFKGAQLDFEWLKMQEDSRQLAEAKSLEFLQARTQFRIALQQLAVQQENVELAREIRDKLTLQYKEGVSPLSDLLSAQTAVSEAETNYWQQVFGYKLAALKLAKAAGKRIIE